MSYVGTAWPGKIFVGRYLSPGALYFNREVRQQGTDLWIQWENCVNSFEKQHTSTCTDWRRDLKRDEARCHVNHDLKEDSTPLKNTLKCPEPMDDISQHSSKGAPLINFLCYCSYMIEICTFKPVKELENYYDILTRACVQPPHHLYMGKNKPFHATVAER